MRGSVGADDIKATPVAATVRLGRLMFQTKRWNEAIRMARPKRRSRHPGIRQALALAPGSFPALAQTRAAL
jgi:hypothetical protein